MWRRTCIWTHARGRDARCARGGGHSPSPTQPPLTYVRGTTHIRARRNSLRRGPLSESMFAHVAVAAALAAAPWSAPQTLSSPHQFVDPVDVAFGANGSALASWTFQDGTNRAATTGAAVASRPAGASAFSPQRTLIAAHGADRGATLIGIVPVGAGR